MQRQALAVSVLAGAAAALLVALPVVGAAQAADWKAIQKPSLRPFVPQQPVRVALPNGMVLFLQEDHELPFVRGVVRVRGGSREEPAAKTGLVSIYGQVWRIGGTKAKSGDDLDDFLEARGARVETGGGSDSTTLSWDCLSQSFEDVFPVVVDLLREPEFRAEKLGIAKNQLNTGIARRNDDPGGIASREARRLGYGAESPYARMPEYATVAAVTRDDLLAWHKRTVHPNAMLVGVSGDFDAKKMEAAIRRAFGSWPKGPALVKAQVAIQPAKPGVYFVQKDDVNQSNIRMVHLGITRDNPDYHAVEVMNEIFGGGFSARLFSNIRTKKGLAYSVGGGIGSGFDAPGLFQLAMSTKSGSTAAAIDALYEEIDNLLKTPATADELKRAKDAILNSFIFRFDTKQKVLTERMLYEFYGYPSDSLERYRAGIEMTTADDVARVARKYVQKDRIALLVVGKAADLDRPMASFGGVTALDVTIPDADSLKKRAAAPRETTPEARALLERVVQGLGGADRLRAVMALRQKTAVKRKTPQGEMSIDAETITSCSGRLYQRMRTPMGEMVMVLSPEAAFMTMGPQTRDLPASQREALVKSLKTNPVCVAQAASDPKLVLATSGQEKVGDVEASILDVQSDGAEARWWVDPGTGRILRISSRATGPTGPAEEVREFDDWRVVDGLSLAFKTKVKTNGEDSGSQEVVEAQVNPEIDPKLLEKPAAPPAP
jgi:zinc protease